MSDKLRYAIRVTGRVQGVGFRYSAYRRAQDTGITGYVKNLPDGSVQIEAEGSKDQLDTFVEWCRKGPGLSYVESVIVDPFPPARYKEFRIYY
ncbi:MAG TPA: acylphosphatase [Bacteroidales bacterium]|nr:acylphosphatase [Bacteroidales bacterium]